MFYKIITLLFDLKNKPFDALESFSSFICYFLTCYGLNNLVIQNNLQPWCSAHKLCVNVVFSITSQLFFSGNLIKWWHRPCSSCKWFGRGDKGTVASCDCFPWNWKQTLICEQKSGRPCLQRGVENVADLFLSILPSWCHHTCLWQRRVWLTSLFLHMNHTSCSEAAHIVMNRGRNNFAIEPFIFL